MIVPVLLSSVAAGLIATGVMVFFLYLPRLWDGEYYDVLNALGSAITGRVGERSVFLGSLLYFGAGIVFAFLYGLLAATLLQAGQMFDLPEIMILPDLPLEIDLLFPVVGALLGLAHGLIVALLVTIIVIEHHPIERFRSRYALVASQIISHLAFGATVMFFHSQFLQLLGVGQ